MNLRKDPVPDVIAIPLEKNILEWRFVLRGSEDTEFSGGHFFGKLKFPPEYPLGPPSIMMITPNGRFKCNTRICMSMSDFHPESWCPSWSVGTILTGLLSFMNSNEMTTGGLEASVEERKRYASTSKDFNETDAVFKELFGSSHQVEERFLDIENMIKSKNKSRITPHSTTVMTCTTTVTSTTSTTDIALPSSSLSSSSPSLLSDMLSSTHLKPSSFSLPSFSFPSISLSLSSSSSSSITATSPSSSPSVSIPNTNTEEEKEREKQTGREREESSGERVKVILKDRLDKTERERERERGDVSRVDDTAKQERGDEEKGAESCTAGGVGMSKSARRRARAKKVSLKSLNCESNIICDTSDVMREMKDEQKERENGTEITKEYYTEHVKNT